MTAPTSYSEPGLALYMHAALGKVAELLGYTAPDSYTEQVNDVLTALGASTIASADAAALRVVARREAWRKARADAASLYDFQADGGRYNRSQVLAGIEKSLAAAEQAATAYVSDDARYAADVSPVMYSDPYAWFDSDASTEYSNAE